MRLSKAFRQSGAAMVEMAIVISLFLALVMAVFEFALAIFYSSRLAEATRAGARYAIVSNPTIAALPDCVNSDDSGWHSCSDGSCSEIVTKMNQIVAIKPENIFIRYQCATTGYTGKAGYPGANQEAYNVTVKVEGIEYYFIVPNLLTIPAYITMPSFESTKLSEDQWSPSP